LDSTSDSNTLQSRGSEIVDSAHQSSNELGGAGLENGNVRFSMPYS